MRGDSVDRTAMVLREAGHGGDRGQGAAVAYRLNVPAEVDH
ncbi:hypothetical protein [Streptomyces solicathayae]|uniref:Uncharacterized protein n=1 Tax=Streptomyces solicathayae TaxID=3081768 RepID=A0ABZ0LM78_9ACTN|nr:hypothetical protein [Streptomyces sp. HUAS YS2]WOX20316.1 hypothetical protein R2D22_02500 [Streptomyces sp. HUAS YS2]